MIKNRMRWILPLLLLSNCGEPDKATPSYPQIISERLQQQIDRMLPLVQWTCGGMAPADKPNASCLREGDAVSTTGWSILYGKLGSWNLIRSSIGSDNRPWRNPSRVDNDDNNSFSRDQMLGVLEGTIATKDLVPLQKIRKYIEATGRLCPGDDRCDLTGPIVELMNLAENKGTTTAETVVNGWITLAEARTSPPGYQVHLVLRKIMLYAKLGHLIPDYQRSASVLVSRFPKSLFVRTVDAAVNRKDATPIAADLASCMESWQGPGNAWIGEEIEHGCQTKSYGHEYLSLARYLLGNHSFWLSSPSDRF